MNNNDVTVACLFSCQHLESLVLALIIKIACIRKISMVINLGKQNTSINLQVIWLTPGCMDWSFKNVEFRMLRMLSSVVGNAFFDSGFSLLIK